MSSGPSPPWPAFRRVPKSQPGAAKTATQALVTVFSEDTVSESLLLADELRAAGINCEVYLTPKASLGKQFGYAEKKGIPLAIVLGPDEIASGKAGLKIIETREQKKVGRDKLINEIRNVARKNGGPYLLGN